MQDDEILSNTDIINFIMKHTGVDNPNQLAAFLSEKYGKVTRQQINQFQNTSSVNLTGMLLREAIEAAQATNKKAG